MKRFLPIIIILFLIMAMVMVMPVSAKDRCIDYRTDVRIQAAKYFGLDYPYWYNLGQLKQESQCRADVTAFDAGMGIMQVMPATEKFIESKIGLFDPYNPEQALKAHAWYLSYLHKQNSDGRLWLTFMFYNSGIGTVRKEIQKAGTADYTLMYQVCSRKILILKNGSKLDLCDVGYDYPIRIYKYGRLYAVSHDRREYW